MNTCAYGYGAFLNFDHRYGFQNQEKDDEIKGEGNSLNYTFRMNDPRLGRFFAIDPLASKYPMWAPYAFSGNQVIHTVELEGLEPENRLDAEGNVVPPQIGEIRAGVPGTDPSKNNSWRGYRWLQTSSNKSEWVDLGEILVPQKDGSIPKSSEVLPNGLTNVNISYTEFEGSMTFWLESFTLKERESFKVVNTQKGTHFNGFWNSKGGLYSGMFDSKGSYSGNIYEQNKQKWISYDDVVKTKLNNKYWQEYLKDAAIAIGSQLFEDWLTKGSSSGNPTGPIDLYSSHDNYLEKQAYFALMLSGPGSYVEIADGMGIDNLDWEYRGKAFRTFMFHGYNATTGEPIFEEGYRILKGFKL